MSTIAIRKLVLVSCLVFAVNVADLWSTYLASPDLANEWNVLHRIYGLGWMGLIGAKLIGGACAMAGYAYYLRYRTSCYPDPGLDFHSFSRYFTFGRNITWIESTFAAPAMRHCGVCVGYFWLGMQAIVLWVAFDNVLLAHGIVSPIRAISEVGYHALQSLVIAGLTLARFYAGNFQRYASLSQPVFERAVVSTGQARESVLPR